MGWYNSSWSNRKKLTIDADQVDAALTDFPVYLRFAEDSDLLATARPDGYDVLFTASDGETKLSHDASWQGLLEDDAVGTWFGCSRGIYANGYTYIGWVNAAGDIKIGQYNNSSGAWTTATLSAALEPNDHAAPSITRLGNGKIMVVYAAHNDSVLRCRISSSADDISGFAAEANIDTSDTFNYPAAVVLSGESNAVYVFYNKGGPTARALTYKKSTDNGATWGSAVSVLANSGERPYWHCYPEGGDTIHFCATDGHPNEVTNNSIYHFYYQSSDATWRTSNGTDITGDLTLAPSDLTQVYDSSSSGYKAWTWDIRVDGDGYPVIVYSEYRSRSDHRARYARWNGSSWTDNEIASMDAGISQYGEEFYAAGVTIDDADPDVVYVSESRSGRRVIVAYETANDGASWDSGTIVSQTSNKECIRPCSPWFASSELLCFWFNGIYRYYTDYDTGLQTYPSIVKSVTAEYLVKVPSLSDSADTELYMYYGNSGATDQSDAANAKDSDTLLQAFGSVYGQSLGTVDLSGLGALTFELAAMPYVTPTIDSHIASNWSGTTDAKAMIRIAGADSGDPLEGFVQTTAGTVGRTFTDLSSPTVDSVNFIAMLFDKTDGGLKMHLNGSLSSLAQASTDNLNASASSTEMVAGYSGHAPNNPGTVDARLLVVSGVRRSNGYLTTRDNNWRDTANFYGVGSEEELTPPSITSLLPASVSRNQSGVDITITGTDFVDGADATVSGSGITVNSTTFVSDTELTWNIDLAADATFGYRDVTVTNPDEQDDTLSNGLRVLGAGGLPGTDAFPASGSMMMQRVLPRWDRRKRRR